MKLDPSLFSILSVSNQNQKQYDKLLRHYGYDELGPIPFEAQFLLYCDEIIDRSLSLGDFIPNHRKTQNATDILQQIFRDFPAADVMDIAFNFRLFDYAEDHSLYSTETIQKLIDEKAIQNLLYLPFVSDSHGVILWRHQAENILRLFFANDHVISHYIRELGQKRIPSRERLNQITMPAGEKLGDFLCVHSFLNGIFQTPNLQVASQLWQIANGMDYISHALNRIMNRA